MDAIEQFRIDVPQAELDVREFFRKLR